MCGRFVVGPTPTAPTVKIAPHNGTVVSALSTNDPDTGDSATFTLLEDAGGRFEIVGDELRVADNSLLDFDTAASHNITVRITDSGGLTFDKSFVITLNDVSAGIALSLASLGSGGFKIIGEDVDNHAGFSVASAGDINNDGFADVIVGAARNSAAGINAGAAYVVFGAASGITSVNLDDVASGIGGFKITGENASDGTGNSVSSAGDVNGDGFVDLIIGARGDDEGGKRDAGAAYVIFGSALEIVAVDLDDVALGIGGFKIIGENAGDQAGASVSAAGDVNGDGFNDLIVGASTNWSVPGNIGAAYVVFGAASGISSVNLDDIAAGIGGFKLSAETSIRHAGISVSSAGDVNGDGFDDLIVGAVHRGGCSAHGGRANRR